ncbi:MAG: hypothetical protein KF809_12585 [Chloroflexi bacterium]|nr:hypothetical protein [Chloroflexota bacterium]
MDAPQPEQRIEWFHDGFRVIRVFVQDPMDMATREHVMAAVARFREITDLATLKAEVAAIAAATGLASTVVHQADHVDPFGEWVTIGFWSRGGALPAGAGRSAMLDDPWRT